MSEDRKIVIIDIMQDGICVFGVILGGYISTM